MDLMEYKAKELFFAAGLPLKRGFTGESADEIISKYGAEIVYPVAVKAQVRTGGRGKAGGIKFASDEKELRAAADSIIGMDIKGHIVKRVMAVEKSDVRDEMYLSVILDRDTKCPEIIFCKSGGMEIEETAKTAPESIVRLPVNPLIGVRGYDIKYIASRCRLAPDIEKQLGDVIKRLYSLFLAYDCTLCEINPLAVDGEGRLDCLDGKITVDDNALVNGAASKRHPDLVEYIASEPREPLCEEAEKFNFLYIPIGKGDIAVMSNGSGMIMSCIDLITKNGMNVRCSLDLGGGATAGRIAEAVRIITSDPDVRYLFINIFGGITRCDEVARGIEKAVTVYGIKTPLAVRFEGTNKDAGLEVISSLSGVTFADGLREGVDALIKLRGACGK